MRLRIVFVQPTGMMTISSGAEEVMSPSLWWSTMPLSVQSLKSSGA